MPTIIKTAVQQQWNIDYIDQAGQNIAKDIDFGVLASMLVSSCGWTTVELPSLRSNDDAIDIANWLNLECRPIGGIVAEPLYLKARMRRHYLS